MRIAIISPNKNSTSETFIKAHIDFLSGEKFFLYGSYIPLHYQDKPLTKHIPYVFQIFIKFVLKEDLLKYSIKHFLKSHRINLILAEYGPTGCAIQDIAKKLNIPLIVHFHGYDASSKILLDEYKEKYKSLFKNSVRLVAVSHQMKENLIRLGAEEKKIIYNPCGPSNVFSSVMPDYDNSNFVLFIGRFVNKKAPHLLIEVMKIVRSAGCKIRLIMAGDGELLDTCKDLVKISNLEESVLLIGSVSHEEVVKLMNQSFCYIQHSITTKNGETEGTPVSVLEASLAGLPVISTYHGGIPDVIIHKETGFLVNEFDIEKMAQHLIYLNENRDEARKMGESGKLRIRDNFSLEKHISLLNSVIKESIIEK